MACTAELVFESSQDSTSTLTYFSQNGEKTETFVVDKFTKKTPHIGLDWV